MQAHACAHVQGPSSHCETRFGSGFTTSALGLDGDNRLTQREPGCPPREGLVR